MLVKLVKLNGYCSTVTLVSRLNEFSASVGIPDEQERVR